MRAGPGIENWPGSQSRPDFDRFYIQFPREFRVFDIIHVGEGRKKGSKR